MDAALASEPAPRVAAPSGRRRMLLGITCALALIAVGALLPKWLQFLVTMAASHGLVSLGIVLMMRGGVVSFGQGLVFAAGAYGAALAYTRLGITDAVGLAAIGAAGAMLVAAPFAPLLA